MSHAILPSLYPNPSHEQHRLAALARFDIASKPLQRDLEGLSRLAQILTNTPLALINIIGRDEQVTVCSVGVQLPPVARESSLCHHTVLKHDLLYLPDTLADPRFVDHPMVNGQLSAARMYAGAPLLTEDGQALGALCVADLVVHELSDAQLEALRELAAQVVSTLELHRHASLLARSYSDLEDFAGLVARDVHRPLVKAIDHTETLADYLLVGSPLTGETLRQLHGALTDTRNILDEVMGTTAAHNSPAHFAPHDLNLIADHAVDQVQHSLPHNPTRVFITRLPTVEVDEQMMLHLLRTLVTNAMLNVDAQQRPTVQISARESGRGWVIIVEDSGMGEEVCAGGEVSSGSLTTAASAAATASPDSSPDSPGDSTLMQGYEQPRLGLAICRRIIERHNGHLWFEDSTLGGVRVCLYLPTTQPTSPTTADLEAQTALEVQASSASIAYHG